jgi:hypothetical protein
MIARLVFWVQGFEHAIAVGSCHLKSAGSSIAEFAISAPFRSDQDELANSVSARSSFFTGAALAQWLRLWRRKLHHCHKPAYRKDKRVYCENQQESRRVLFRQSTRNPHGSILEMRPLAGQARASGQ